MSCNIEGNGDNTGAKKFQSLSGFPMSCNVALRNHRAAHWHNLTHEELWEKRAVPGRVPWNNQLPLCMGGAGEEDDTA